MPKTGVPGEGTEYSGVSGPAGIPKHRPRSALSASDQARLDRIVGVRDPKAPVSDRVWNGEAIEKTQRQREGEAAEARLNQ